MRFFLFAVILLSSLFAYSQTDLIQWDSSMVLISDIELIQWDSTVSISQTDIVQCDSTVNNSQTDLARCDSTVGSSYKIERCYNAFGQHVSTVTSKRGANRDGWQFVRKEEFAYDGNEYTEVHYEWHNGWIPQKKFVSFNGGGKHVSEEYEMDSVSGQWQGVRKTVVSDKPDTTQQVEPVYVWQKDENKWIEKTSSQTNAYLQQVEKYIALGWCRTAQWYYSEYKRLYNASDTDIETQLLQCQNAPDADGNDITTLYWAQEEKRRECKEQIEECLSKEYCQLADYYYKELMLCSSQRDTLVESRIRDCGKKYSPSQIYIRVEKMAEYVKGRHSLFQYIEENASLYPWFKGVVVVQFVVTTEGTVADPQIVKSVSPEADQKAIEIITSLSGKFIPGEQAGEKVPVLLSYPIPYSKDERLPEGIFLNY